MKRSKGRKNTGKTKNKVMVRSSSEGLTLMGIFSYPIIPSGINPTIGSTQGQRKTLTKVGFEPTTFGLDNHTTQLHSCEKLHSSVRLSLELRIITLNMLLTDNSLRLGFRVIGYDFVSTKDQVTTSCTVFTR